MPKINVYLPDALASAVKDARVPVSAVCQAALSDAVERIGKTRSGIAALRDPAAPAAILRRIGEGTRKRMTPRLAAALGVAALDADGQARPAISSLDLLRGLLDDGENLAVRLLLNQGADVDALAEASRASEHRRTRSSRRRVQRHRPRTAHDARTARVRSRARSGPRTRAQLHRVRTPPRRAYREPGPSPRPPGRARHPGHGTPPGHRRRRRRRRARAEQISRAGLRRACRPHPATRSHRAPARPGPPAHNPPARRRAAPTTRSRPATPPPSSR